MYEVATIAMGVTALSAAGSAYYSYESGQKNKETYEENASIAEKDAALREQIAAQDALAIKEKAGYDEDTHRQRIRTMLSRQRSMYGKSGVATEGSPLLVMQETADQGEMDALAIRYGGDVEAARVKSGASADASRARSEANLLRIQGRTAGRLGYIQAGSTLLQGAGQAMTKKNYQTQRT